MTNVTVIGAQWGDEGKGKVVDWLSSRADVVVRFQGGHNAGHTLVVGNETYKLSLLPSGLVRGKLGIIGNGVVIDPEALLAEIARVRAQGLAVSPETLRIAENAVLILPVHGAIDRAREAARGERKIGTTGRGIGPAYEDKVARRAIRVCDLAEPETLSFKLDELLLHHNTLLKGLGAETFEKADVLARLLELAPEILPYVEPVWERLDELKRAGKRILFEGAQAVMLDVDHGTYPYVTSSNTVAATAASGSGIGPSAVGFVLGIAKAYTTRVGAGPFPTEVHGELGDRIVDIGHEFGTVTGRRRRPGWLDLVMLRHAVRVNSLTDIALTKLDVLDDFDTIRVCVGYQLNGEELQGFPDDAETLAGVECVYVDIAGWKQSLRACRREADLPSEVLLLLSLVEQHTKVPVSVVGVGPERDDVVLRGASS